MLVADVKTELDERAEGVPGISLPDDTNVTVGLTEFVPIPLVSLADVVDDTDEIIDGDDIIVNVPWDGVTDTLALDEIEKIEIVAEMVAQGDEDGESFADFDTEVDGVIDVEADTDFIELSVPIFSVPDTETEALELKTGDKDISIDSVGAPELVRAKEEDSRDERDTDIEVLLDGVTDEDFAIEFVVRGEVDVETDPLSDRDITAVDEPDPLLDVERENDDVRDCNGDDDDNAEFEEHADDVRDGRNEADMRAEADPDISPVCVTETVADGVLDLVALVEADVDGEEDESIEPVYTLEIENIVDDEADNDGKAVVESDCDGEVVADGEGVGDFEDAGDSEKETDSVDEVVKVPIYVGDTVVDADFEELGEFEPETVTEGEILCKVLREVDFVATTDAEDDVLPDIVIADETLFTVDPVCTIGVRLVVIVTIKGVCDCNIEALTLGEPVLEKEKRTVTDGLGEEVVERDILGDTDVIIEAEEIVDNVTEVVTDNEEVDEMESFTVEESLAVPISTDFELLGLIDELAVDDDHNDIDTEVEGEREVRAEYDSRADADDDFIALTDPKAMDGDTSIVTLPVAVWGTAVIEIRADDDTDTEAVIDFVGSGDRDEDGLIDMIAVFELDTEIVPDVDETNESVEFALAVIDIRADLDKLETDVDDLEITGLDDARGDEVGLLEPRTLCVTDIETITVVDTVADGEVDRETVGVLDRGAERLWEPVTLDETESLGEWVGVTLTLILIDRRGEAEYDVVPVDVIVLAREPEEEPDTDGEWEADGEIVEHALTLGEPDDVAVRWGVTDSDDSANGETVFEIDPVDVDICVSDDVIDTVGLILDVDVIVFVTTADLDSVDTGVIVEERSGDALGETERKGVSEDEVEAVFEIDLITEFVSDDDTETEVVSEGETDDVEETVALFDTEGEAELVTDTRGVFVNLLVTDDEVETDTVVDISGDREGEFVTE